MEHLRIGVVGVGGMGSFHARTLASLAGVDVTFVADASAGAAATTAAAVGAAVVDDPIALITDAGIDGVVIASPDATHADLAVAAIERGLFTLCEKPLATTVADALRVVDSEAAGRRRLVQLGFMREYDPAHTQLVAELAPLGEIVSVHTTHRNSNASPRPLELIVGQSIVHDLHSIRFITGAEIESVQTSVAGVDGEVRHVLVLCRLTTGAHAVIEFDDCGFAYEVSVEVIAEHGDVITGSPLRPVRRRSGSVDVHLGPDWFGWFADAYRIQDQAWIDSIRAGAATGPSAADGLTAQLLVDDVLASITDSFVRRADRSGPAPDRPR